MGRPPKYKTPEELQEKIDEYFDTGIAERKVLVGPSNNRSIQLLPVPTITGLVLYLDFCSRQSFYDMEKHKEFAYTIKKARTRIEREYEEQLQTGSPTGAIFALKNFDWKDKETENGGVRITNIVYGYRAEPTDSPIRKDKAREIVPS